MILSEIIKDVYRFMSFKEKRDSKDVNELVWCMAYSV